MGFRTKDNQTPSTTTRRKKKRAIVAKRVEKEGRSPRKTQRRASKRLSISRRRRTCQLDQATQHPAPIPGNPVEEGGRATSFVIRSTSTPYTRQAGDSPSGGPRQEDLQRRPAFSHNRLHAISHAASSVQLSQFSVSLSADILTARRVLCRALEPIRTSHASSTASSNGGVHRAIAAAAVHGGCVPPEGLELCRDECRTSVHRATADRHIFTAVQHTSAQGVLDVARLRHPDHGTAVAALHDKGPGPRVSPVWNGMLQTSCSATKSS